MKTMSTTKIAIFIITLILTFSCKDVTIVETFVDKGNIFITKSDGTIQQITFLGKDNTPLLSPNHEVIYFIRETGNLFKNEYNYEMQQLAIMKVDLLSLRELKLTDKIHYKDWNQSSELFRVGNFSMSDDGKYIFFLTQKWVVTDVLVRLDTDTNLMTEISHGDGFEILKEGVFKNHLLITRGEIKENAGRQWSYWIIDINGNKIKEIGDENAVKIFKENQKEKTN